MIRCVLIFVATAGVNVAAVDVDVNAQQEGHQCLLQAKQSLSGKVAQSARSSVSTEELIAAEAIFTTGEADHGDVGGDRMSEPRHNYGPIYAKHLTSFLEAGEVSTVAEVGILKGTGLAMWSSIFPQSKVFGFDLNTSSYQNNVAHMRSVGFDDSRVKVTAMNQMQDNTQLLQSVFGELHPHVVIDDGYHIPQAGEKTFFSMKPFLAERFVYFIEDLIPKEIDDGLWDPVKSRVLRECPTCTFAFECPPTSDKNECVAVIHRQQKPVQ